MSTPITISTNSDLVMRIREGDSTAFEDLFNAHKARIYSLCLRMTNNTADAEDLTQDAFLQVFRNLSRFRGESALSTWLYRIAVNTVLMHLRKKTICRVSFDDCTETDDRPLRRQCGREDSRLSGTVDRIWLIHALKQLPAGYRRMFLLHEVQGYEHLEIGKLLNCSAGNSKSQLHKAKVRIGKILTRTHEVLESTNNADSAEQINVEPAIRESADLLSWQKSPTNRTKMASASGAMDRRKLTRVDFFPNS